MTIMYVNVNLGHNSKSLFSQKHSSLVYELFPVNLVVLTSYRFKTGKLYKFCHPEWQTKRDRGDIIRRFVTTQQHGEFCLLPDD